MSGAKTIKEEIELLKKLQLVDGEIYLLNREKQGFPLRVGGIERALETKKAGIKESEEKLKALQVRLKDNEVDLQQKEEHIKKLQIQLYQLKTNKEYSMMLTEIEGIKADSSLIEDEIIRLMDEIEKARGNMKEEKELFKKEEELAQKEKEMISARENEIDARLSELDNQRSSLTPGADKKILAMYERVLRNKDGLAIVSAADGACGGCHINLPPQVVSEAKIKEKIIICSTCSRILYVDDDVEID